MEPPIDVNLLWRCVFYCFSDTVYLQSFKLLQQLELSQDLSKCYNNLIFSCQTSCSIISKFNFTPILRTHAEWNPISGKHDTDISKRCSWESPCFLIKCSEPGFHCEYFCQYSFYLNFHYDYLLNSAPSLQGIF